MMLTLTCAVNEDEPEPSSDGGDPARPLIEIAVTPAGLAFDQTMLIDALRAVLPHVQAPVDRVGIQVVDDGGMCRLHETHHNDPTTTDVLTFDLRATPDPAVPIDVDIAICIDEARRQATARGHRLEHELLLYLVHGVLHCAGFDDHTDDDFAAMHAEEDRLLRAAGIGDVFATRPDHRDPASGGAAS